MRLVSAIYADFHPFDHLVFFESHDVVTTPDDLKAGDVLIVHGGADIPVEFYNKRRSSANHSRGISNRDQAEFDLMKRAKELNIPIIGICRGAQMLCALEGGFLYQHVNGHGGRHKLEAVCFNGEKELIEVNSIHHQMMVPRGNYEIKAALPCVSNVYYDYEDREVIKTQHELGVDPEFIYYPDIKGFAIQWHPEMMKADCSANKYVLNFINEALNG